MNTRNYSYFFKIILFTILALSGSGMANAQDHLFDLDIINIEDGLPHRNAYDIVQDKEGYIWVSTLGGISRYDGYTFKTYNASFLNIPDNSIPRMAVDAENRLWYTTGFANKVFYGGVINTQKDTIYSMEAISEGCFSSKDVLHVGNFNAISDIVFIVTRDGSIYEYEEDFKEIYHLPDPISSLVLFEAAPDGSYWITHGREIIRVKDGEVLKTVTIPDNTGHIKKIITISSGLIVEFYKDTLAPFIKFWKLENDHFVPFTITEHTPEEITGLFQFHKDYSCYGTKDELLIRDSQGTIMYRFDAFEILDDKKGVGYQKAFLDRQNTLWIVTGNGILKVTARKNPFTILEPRKSIRGIYREEEQLWIGGYSGSIVRNTTTGTQKEFLPGPFSAISPFYKDHKGDLWIGTSRGMIIQYIPGTDSYVIHTLDSNFQMSFQKVFQNAVIKTYWVGTNKGLFRFDPVTKKVIPFSLPIPSEELYIRQLYQNEQGIWILSNKGIFLMDAQQETILKHYTTVDGLPTNNINHIYEDDNDTGIFWLGTKGEGLVRWDLKEKTFRQYTQKDGLSNTNIYAVYEDAYNTLWLPSDYGLMGFDKNTETIKVYLPQNGIAHEEFNMHAHFQAEDGTFYFGGLNGVTKFHPEDLQQQYTTAPPLYATGIRVLKKGSETFTDQTSTYNTTQKIRLRPGDRILELELTLLDYEKSAENQYAYTLSGQQDQWIYTTDNKISIMNPPYGRYDLVIKARGASGQWSEKWLSIPLHVQAPFYLQWWFFVAVFMVVAIGVLLVFRWRVQKLRKDRERLEDEVQKRTRQIAQDKRIIEQQAESLQALDKAKTRFFANITHEFRTPLTLVTGPVAQLIAAPPPPAILKKRLSGVLKNGQHLLGLINQLLDLSKLENDKMTLEITQDDIVGYTGELVQQFQPLAAKKDLQLEFSTPLREWKTHLDKDKWHKILYNLLSNALKFTPKGGSIYVRLQKLQENEQDSIQLQVADTGIGIEPAKRAHIFDRFYQADASSTRLQGGTGIGLALVKELVELQNGSITVESTPGEGTAFTVKLPLLPVSSTEEAVPLTSPETLPLPIMEETLWEQNGAEAPKPKDPEKLSLLIIEDNAGMRAYIRSCIDASKYHISEAADGEEGIEKALEMVPDLIISDVMMPKKNGFEVARAIRSHIATSHIPLILLTAKASLESRLEGLERGADAYLTKPFSPEELVLRIKKLIEFRRLLQARYQTHQLPEADPAFEKEDEFISELKSYIIENITQSNLSGDRISKQFAMSRAQFYRKLKALKNTSLGDFIRSIRLNMAVQLLKKQELNITEIAYETGFSSIGSFSRAFKRVYGKAPSEFL